MSYPDVVIACIERDCLWKHSTVGAALAYDNMKDYSPGGWLITITLIIQTI